MASFSDAHLNRDLRSMTRHLQDVLHKARGLLGSVILADKTTALHQSTCVTAPVACMLAGTLPCTLPFQRNTPENSLGQASRRGSLVVSVDGSAHAFNNDQVCAHGGVCEGVWHPSEVQAGAALAVACHIQARFPAAQRESESGPARHCYRMTHACHVQDTAQIQIRIISDPRQRAPTKVCRCGPVAAYLRGTTVFGKHMSLLQASAMQVST